MRNILKVKETDQELNTELNSYASKNAAPLTRTDDGRDDQILFQRCRDKYGVDIAMHACYVTVVSSVLHEYDCLNSFAALGSLSLSTRGKGSAEVCVAGSVHSNRESPCLHSFPR